jgi:hypothetical protein
MIAQAWLSVFRKSLFSVTVQSNLMLFILSADQSYDPDALPSDNSTLDFSWSCSSSSGTSYTQARSSNTIFFERKKKHQLTTKTNVCLLVASNKHDNEMMLISGI